MARQDKTDLRATVADNIKILMDKNGIESLSELSTLAQVSRSMISTILSCKTSPRVDTIQRIAEALSCPASALFHSDSQDIPALRDAEFLALYTRYQLASDRDRDLVKRLLMEDSQ